MLGLLYLVMGTLKRVDENSESRANLSPDTTLVNSRQAESTSETKAGAESTSETKAGAESTSETEAGAESTSETKAGAESTSETKAGAESDKKIVKSTLWKKLIENQNVYGVLKLEVESKTRFQTLSDGTGCKSEIFCYTYIGNIAYVTGPGGKQVVLPNGFGLLYQTTKDRRCIIKNTASDGYFELVDGTVNVRLKTLEPGQKYSCECQRFWDVKCYNFGGEECKHWKHISDLYEDYHGTKANVAVETKTNAGAKVLRKKTFTVVDVAPKEKS